MTRPTAALFLCPFSFSASLLKTNHSRPSFLPVFSFNCCCLLDGCRRLAPFFFRLAAPSRPSILYDDMLFSTRLLKSACEPGGDSSRRCCFIAPTFQQQRH